MRAILASSLLALCVAAPASAGERTMYVSGDGLNVRLCADADCCIADRLSVNDPVSVFEDDGRWARISVYFDADSSSRDCKKPEENLRAHWVSLDYLTPVVPDGTDPNAWYGSLGDSRIRGIPKIGDYGLQRSDLETIRRYGSQLLLNGVCEGIDTGNKSVSRENTYYVLCEGENEKRYFGRSDVAG